MEPRARTAEEIAANPTGGTPDLDSALDSLAPKPLAEKPLDENSASTVSMERHATPALKSEAAQPEEQPGPLEAELKEDQSRRGAQRGSRVQYGETINPWYLVSHNNGVTVMVMKAGGENSILLTRTPEGVTQTFLPNMKFGACHDAHSKLDGTHQLYVSGTSKPMHLAEPEVRRMGMKAPGRG